MTQTYIGHVLSGRHALGHQQLEHGERQQHRDPQGNLLPRVGRQVEAQRGQEGDEEAREEQVEDVEGGATLQQQGEGDVGVRVRAAAVHDDVLDRRHAVALPLHVLYKIRQVTARDRHDDINL